MKHVHEPTEAELAEILQQHGVWLEEYGRLPSLDDPQVADDRRRANLSGANLVDANLNNANLNSAELGGANLSGAKLNHAELNNANLVGAFLIDAELNGAGLISANMGGANLERAKLSAADADLSGAILSGAKLSGANLSGANLNGADLSGANLGDANLSGADLIGAKVGRTKLTCANLTNVTYAPKAEPPDSDVAGIKGLATMRTLKGEQRGLVQLRKLFKDAGLYDNEREVTHAIQRSITQDQMSEGLLRPGAWIVGILRIVGFGLTTAYGLYPERALCLILLLGALVTPAYIIAILQPSADSGIIRVFPADRLEGTVGNPADEAKRKKQLVHAEDWRKALGTAAYFSLISAVNIGFEQFTPDDWIRRLQSRDYSLQAVGWVRVVAGAQSLISVYLLAMWVLTQFGKPFE